MLIVKPGGTGSPRLLISARFAPLPPSRSRWSLLPSEKSYTYFVMPDHDPARGTALDATWAARVSPPLDPAHRLMPESTASSSMAASSSSVSGGPVERVEVGVELLDRGGADDRGGDPPVAQRPLQRQLGELLAAGPGDLVEPAHVPQRRVVEVVRRSCCRSRAARESAGHAVEVAVGEQPLGQRA